MNLNGHYAGKGAEAISAFAEAIAGMPAVFAEQGQAIMMLLMLAQIGQDTPGVGDDKIMEPIRMAQGEIASVIRSLLVLRHSIDVLGPIVVGCGRDFGLDDLEMEAIANEVHLMIGDSIRDGLSQIEDGLDDHPDL